MLLSKQARTDDNQEQHTLLCLRDFIQVTTVHADIGACNLKRPLDKLSWPTPRERELSGPGARHNQTWSMWGSKAFLSTEPLLVSRISSRAAKAAEEKFDLILFQSLAVSMDTRWTSSLAAVAEFITTFQVNRSQPSRDVTVTVCMERSPKSGTRPRDAHTMSSSSTQAIDALEAQVNLVSSLSARTAYS